MNELNEWRWRPKISKKQPLCLGLCSFKKVIFLSWQASASIGKSLLCYPRWILHVHSSCTTSFFVFRPRKATLFSSDKLITLQSIEFNSTVHSKKITTTTTLHHETSYRRRNKSPLSKAGRVHRPFHRKTNQPHWRTTLLPSRIQRSRLLRERIRHESIQYRSKR